MSPLLVEMSTTGSVLFGSLAGGLAFLANAGAARTRAMAISRVMHISSRKFAAVATCKADGRPGIVECARGSSLVQPAGRGGRLGDRPRVCLWRRPGFHPGGAGQASIAAGAAGAARADRLLRPAA